ncbi:MAG TPA: YidB family protein [Micromonosporaceae bacterium]|nr:YidB family protein [Micromonosporaceae bacterium]
MAMRGGEIGAMLGGDASGVGKILEGLLGGASSVRGGPSGTTTSGAEGATGGAGSNAGGSGSGPGGAASKSASDPIGTRDAPLPMPAGPGSIGSSFIELLERLRRNGLGDHVDSWVGDGPNKPIDGAQITGAIGEQQLADLATDAGVSTPAAASGVARALPDVVSELTPRGVMPDPAAVHAEIHRLLG